MKPGAYFEDAKKMFGFAAPLIDEGMSNDQVIQAFQWISNGLEKLLKHGLESINPLFIQKLPDFKHSAALYRERFVAGYTGNEVEKEPNDDVITFRTSLNRLRVFSEPANTHSQLLHTIAGWRDTLAHRPSSELPIEEIKRMLLRDVSRLVEDFSVGFSAKPEDFLGSRTKEMKDASDAIIREDQIAQHMTALLDKHRKLWDSKKGDTTYVNLAHQMTEKELGQASAEFHNDDVPCPACGETAIVRIEPYYDYADGESYLSGAYPERLVCYHCGLDLSSYEEFNYIDLDSLLARE